MAEIILSLAAASLLYPFAVLMVAITGPHSEFEREANRLSFRDSDGVRQDGDANAAPVPKHRQARAEGIAQEGQP